MGGDYDSDAGDSTLVMSTKEEVPAFREGRHPHPSTTSKITDKENNGIPFPSTTTNTTTVVNAAMMVKPLDKAEFGRGDSASSTEGSTIAASSESLPHHNKVGQHDSHTDFSSSTTSTSLIRCTEHASDGDWLKQLQYRLYSREDEEAILLRTYQNSRRLSSHHRTKNATGGELCLISGAAGLGKTRLARSLEDAVHEDGGYFVSAKFDQVKGARPIRIFADAFTEFTHAVLAQGPEVVEATRQNIVEALGDEMAVLLSGIPVLERIVGPPANGRTVQMNCQMAKRFVFALQDLVSAVCTMETPMVLLFDDLQWADSCSLKLLKAFICYNQNKHLFIMGTCDDSGGPCSPISGMLRELENESSRQIYNIEVSQKPCSTTWKIITEALPMPKDRHDVLAKLVCGQTQGNPLYIMEFLRWLSDEELLQYDAAEGTWILHDSDERLALNTFCLGSFLVHNLQQLPDDVKEVIKVAACLGNEIDEALLKAVLCSEVVTEQLHEATSHGVFVFDDEKGYSFRHDGLQNAALRLMTDKEKDALHLRLGRDLLGALSESARQKHLFLILGQLKHGMRLMKDKHEKESVALLCLTAGQTSARASSFSAAAGYFEFGIEMIGSSWDEDYSLKLALYNAAAEMHLTVSNYERVHELLQEVFDNVTKLKHKIQAYTTLIYAYGVTDQQHLAVDTGVKVLEELGEAFPRRNCMAMLRGEMRRVKGLLRGKSNASILRMEIIRNEDKIAALQLLNIMFLNAMLVKPKFAPFIQLKSVQITLEYGLSAMSSSAFASYGMLCAAAGQYEEAFRYGQLSLDLLQKFKAKEYAPRVFASVYGKLASSIIRIFS